MWRRRAGSRYSDDGRLVVAARLKPGTRARAAELVAEGPPFDPRGSGLISHGVYLSEHEVVFAFEGPGAEYLVQGDHQRSGPRGAASAPGRR